MFASLALAATLVWPTSLAQDPAQPPVPIGRRAETDQTVPVTKGMRIDVDHCAGDAVVKTWDRDAVRVRATHSRATRVRLEPRGQVLAIEIDADRGPGSADLELTVPAWIGVRLEGPTCFVEVEGVGGAVSVETVEGDVTIRGVSGTLIAKTIDGAIVVEGSRGRAELSTTEGDITISNASGEIVAETIDGDVTIRDSQATALEISTVDGNIAFAGIFAPAGRYLFVTHDGDVSLAIPDSTSATFGVRVFNDGKVDSTLPLKSGVVGRRGQRTVHTLGGGAAQVEVEVFEGTFRIRRPGEMVKQKD